MVRSRFSASMTTYVAAGWTGLIARRVSPPRSRQGRRPGDQHAAAAAALVAAGAEGALAAAATALVFLLDAAAPAEHLFLAGAAGLRAGLPAGRVALVARVR